MGINKKISHVNKLSFQHKCWLVYFFVGSFVAWLALRFVAIRNLAKKMGVHVEARQISTLAKPEQEKMALEMGELLTRIANNTPWECACLAQALCIKSLLNQYKIPSILYLGASLSRADSNQANVMKAHSWVDVRSTTIIGGPQHRQYQVVASFVSLKFD